MSLTKPNGAQTINEDEAKTETIRYFNSLLGTSSSVSSPGITELRHIIQKRIPTDQSNLLDSIPSDDEIKETV